MRANSLTTHEVAALLEVSPSAVLTWIAKGWLNAHRTPGGHRRVATLDLVRFLRGRRMPVPAALTAVERLLFIDDDPVFLRNARRLMKRHVPELSVETSEGAMDGLIKVGTYQPNAVILDAFMPGIDGVELCHRLRESADTEHIAVVALTGHPGRDLARRFEDAGALACLSKPLDVSALLRVLGLKHGHEVMR